MNLNLANDGGDAAEVGLLQDLWVVNLVLSTDMNEVYVACFVSLSLSLSFSLCACMCMRTRACVYVSVCVCATTRECIR